MVWNLSINKDLGPAARLVDVLGDSELTYMIMLNGYVEKTMRDYATADSRGC